MRFTGIKKKRHNALRRSKRTRSRLHGTATHPRLSVQRSLSHIYVQLINDDARVTLASASDREVLDNGKPLERAQEVGRLIGGKARALGITKAMFDRGSYRYHGRVAAIAHGARESGLML